MFVRSKVWLRQPATKIRDQRKSQLSKVTTHFKKCMQRPKWANAWRTNGSSTNTHTHTFAVTHHIGDADTLLSNMKLCHTRLFVFDMHLHMCSRAHSRQTLTEICHNRLLIIIVQCIPCTQTRRTFFFSFIFFNKRISELSRMKQKMP